MLAIIFFSICWTSLHTVALEQQYHQIAQKPLTYLPSASYRPPVPLPSAPWPLVHPNLQVPYKFKVDYQVDSPRKNPDDCPNSDVLHHILSLLNSLISNDKSFYYDHPDRKLQVLEFIKNYLEKAEHEQVEEHQQINESVIETDNVPSVELPNSENLKSPVEAEFVLKYKIPGSLDVGCKEALHTLIQVVNGAHLQLTNYCRQTRRCVFDNQSLKSPSLSNIRSSQPIPIPDNPINHNPSNIRSQSSINNIPLPQVQNDPKDYFTLKHHSNQQSLAIDNINSGLNENKNPIERNEKRNVGPPHAHHQLSEQFEELNNPVEPSDWENLQHLITLVGKETYEPVSTSVQNTLHSPFDRSIDQNLYNFRGNLLQPSFSNNIHSVANQVVSSKFENTKQLLHSNNVMVQHRHTLNPINSDRNDVYYNPLTKDMNDKGKLISSPNPYLQANSNDYLKHVYGDKLFDSQRVASVSNLLKLNSPVDYNGDVELTYMLRHPQSLPYKPYYYVKYRLPYKDFLSTIIALAKNPVYRSDPIKIHEELLSISNIAERSPDLRTFKNDELSKLIRNDGAFIHAKLLGNAKTDAHLRTVQAVNANLNTNEILNLVETDSRPHTYLTGALSNLKQDSLNQAQRLNKDETDRNQLLYSGSYNTNRETSPIIHPSQQYTSFNDLSHQGTRDLGLMQQSFSSFPYHKPDLLNGLSNKYPKNQT